MKISLTLGTPRPLTRAEAWGCVTANLAVPGTGSLAAGRAVGYFQMALTFIGFVMSLVFGAALFRWYFANSERIAQLKQDDPIEALVLILNAMRWSLLGVALFVFALAWAGVTSFQIVHGPRREE